MTEDLLKCPECGSTKIVRMEPGDDEANWYYQCANCDTAFKALPIDGLYRER